MQSAEIVSESVGMSKKINRDKKRKIFDISATHWQMLKSLDYFND